MSESGWLVRARVARYGVPVAQDGNALELAPGCFARSLAKRFPPLKWWHRSEDGVGVAVDYDDTLIALDMTFDVPPDLLAESLVRAMTANENAEFSVAFRFEDNGSGIVKIATLDEISFVPKGACPGTRLLRIEPAPPRPTRSEGNVVDLVQHVEREADEILANFERNFGRRRRDYDPAEFWSSYAENYR